MQKSDWVVTGTIENFQELVEKSRSVPLVVDFWATWCAPCRQLAPMLDQAVQNAAGAFLLVKVNVDEQQEIAQSFGIQSIPTLFAVKEGKIFDQLQGLVSESELQAWLKTLLPDPYETLLKEAQSLDPAGAELKYREAITLKPDHWAARVALGNLLLKQERDGECLALIAELDSRGISNVEVEQLKAEVEFREQSRDSGGISAAREALAKDPQNADLQLQLADALSASHQFQEALDLALGVAQKHKAQFGDRARETMVKIFTILGPVSELAQSYRRKLAVALY